MCYPINNIAGSLQGIAEPVTACSSQKCVQVDRCSILATRQCAAAHEAHLANIKKGRRQGSMVSLQKHGDASQSGATGAGAVLEILGA